MNIFIPFENNIYTYTYMCIYIYIYPTFPIVSGSIVVVFKGKSKMVFD